MKKITSISLAVVLFSAFNLIAQPPYSFEDVIKADQELNALILKNNFKGAVKYYADDFILTTSLGSKKLKDEILQEIASPDLQLEINETSSPTVRIVGNTAVLTGVLHQKGIYQGKTFDAYMLVTDTWVYNKNKWQILAGHATILKDHLISSATANE